MKSDEYILGQAEKPWKPNLSEAESEDEREEDKEEKVWALTIFMSFPFPSLLFPLDSHLAFQWIGLSLLQR